MSVNSVTTANGMFSITDASGKSQTVDLGTLMMMLQLDRVNSLDKQIKMQMDEIQERNTLVSQMTDFLAQMRKMKASGSDDGIGNDYNTGGTIEIGGVKKTLKGPGDTWTNHFGIQGKWTDVIGSRGSKSGDDLAKWNSEWDANIELIKGKLDGLNSDSQMDMIKLQQLLDKRGTALQEATKVMDSNQQTYSAIIQNL